MNEYKFPYLWNLKDATFTKDKGNVFSCFACGGGSTMGYKLAGFNVLGCNEIDPKMIEAYRANHKPKYSFLEPIQDFKQRKDLPEDLYNLDILDGSPPCSSFSMAGLREKAWGKQKKFREGQSLQVLDTLFFDFIDLAKELKPKVVVAENVKGLLLGNAKNYVENIYKAFDEAGYYCNHFLLNSSNMGVPQRRERVFFICLRKDLAKDLLEQKNMFKVLPKIDLKFNEREIPFKEIEDQSDTTLKDNTKISTFWDLVDFGQPFSKAHPKGSFFNDNKSHPDRALPTITADTGHGSWHYNIKRRLNDLEVKKAGSYPLDYNFCRNKPKYLVGMSVPPVMVAQIATEIYAQWLSKIQCS
jgi:DNA (cytosine-5)-methyltransferase 1|tara:strand:- start:1122 stop:2192 length:1071 start_codon:yes stop_codon:yes gene_type:complete